MCRVSPDRRVGHGHSERPTPNEQGHRRLDPKVGQVRGSSGCPCYRAPVEVDSAAGLRLSARRGRDGPGSPGLAPRRAVPGAQQEIRRGGVQEYVARRPMVDPAEGPRGRAPPHGPVRPPPVSRSMPAVGTARRHRPWGTPRRRSPAERPARRSAGRQQHRHELHHGRRTRAATPAGEQPSGTEHEAGYGNGETGRARAAHYRPRDAGFPGQERGPSETGQEGHDQ